MKPDIHPKYRFVVFHDVSCDFTFLTRSTIETKKTMEYEGKEYPLVVMDISSKSHPFYTGTQKILDTAGRVERFYQKYGFQRDPALDGDESEAPKEAASATPTEAPEEPLEDGMTRVTDADGNVHIIQEWKHEPEATAEEPAEEKPEEPAE